MRAMLLAALLLCFGGPATAAEIAFPAAVLQSVVKVLPLRPPGVRPPKEISGSGVVIRKGGYIATNHHVIVGAESVSVRIPDGRELPAHIVSHDAATDIALLKIEEDLPPLAAAAEPPVGARVCTASFPFGVGPTVTCGVVSAVRRTNMGFNAIEDFIQTDAGMNPGSSGGALVDGNGKLVGLAAAIFTRAADANIGVNFAISAALLNRVVDDLLAHGRVNAPKLVLPLASLAPAERQRYAGLRVELVKPGGVAARAGLEQGDIVTAVAGRTVHLDADVRTALFLHRPGERVAVTVLRQGHKKTLTLEIPK